MKTLNDVKEGDIVFRVIGGKVLMALEVTALTGERIVCGPWEFDRSTGAEIDEQLGWDGKTVTGSYIKAERNDQG